MLLYYGLAPTYAQPLKKYGRRTVGGRERLHWVEHIRAAAAAPTRDDPAVLPPAVRGQLPLFPVRRMLSVDICRRILQRPLAGYADVVEHTAAFATETGISKPMQRKLHEMLRLALAVRDADDLVDELVLNDIPNYVRSVRAILLRAGMLRTWEEPPEPQGRIQPLPARPPRRPPRPRRRATPRSCEHCGCWFSAASLVVCMPCAAFAGLERTRLEASMGRCERCRRASLPLADGRCRGCRTHVATHGRAAEPQSWTQLWFGPPLHVRVHGRRRDNDRPASARNPVSEYLAVPGQQTLFEMRRDWRAVAKLGQQDLPALTDSAEQLLADLDSAIKEQRWTEVPATKTRRTLRILMSWLGADAPVLESDIQALVETRHKVSGRRVTQFLEARGLLTPDPEFRRDTHQMRLEEELGALPQTIAQELRAWIKVVRDEGTWEHAGRSYRSIFRYFHVLKPIIQGWIADGVKSLREIDRADIETAIASRKGTPARYIHIVLRNVFRALRQERVIFRDPTRGLVFAGIKTIPPSVPSDRLAGILSHAKDDFQRFVMVLVCVHALSGTDIRRLLLTDLDLSRERLVVRRHGKRHIIYLDELTYHCASAWIRERHRRWPATTNPHLLINRWTAVDTAHPVIGTNTFSTVFRPTGLAMPTLRQDRIFDEAFDVEDPLHLMRLFGIAAHTAMRYINAAHPERTAKLPR
ncbi:hypothetical protein [Streptomyces sirii]|uniref:hypothetical protein n=1 Tax=Streptomyces sirii TaxID=3127701 RepID=UPI003D36AAD4